MNCTERQHDIVLFLYDELAESGQSELRKHLTGCKGCQEFVEKERQLYSHLTNDFSEWNMPPDLLVECRRDLSEKLDHIESRRNWWRWPRMKPSFSGMRWLEGAAMVSIGLALGVYVTGQQPGETRTPAAETALVSADARVSNLRIVEADPISGEIEFAGDIVSPMRVQGKLDDENVRQAVFSALSAPTNPGERLQLVEFLAPNARDAIVQEALIGSLLNDENPGVRLYALQGLKPFAAEDGVRTALLYVLENDDNPGIRVEAIDALTPLTQDEAMEEVIQEAVRADRNPYVQMRALQFVGR